MLVAEAFETDFGEKQNSAYLTLALMNFTIEQKNSISVPE